MTTPTISEFITARIVDDEAVAHIAASRITSGLDWPFFVVGHHGDDDPDIVVSDLWLRFGPARVLAQCAAYRRILEEHPRLRDDRKTFCKTCGHHWPCPTIRALACVWSDHPDWREEWRA